MNYLKKGKTVGVASATVGAVVGAAAGVILANKKVREKILDKLDTFSNKAADALDVIQSTPKKYAFVGTKGGKARSKNSGQAKKAKASGSSKKKKGKKK